MACWKSTEPGGWKPVTVPHQSLPGSAGLPSWYRVPCRTGYGSTSVVRPYAADPGSQSA
jgi:hypothetical protein